MSYGCIGRHEIAAAHSSEDTEFLSSNIAEIGRVELHGEFSKGGREEREDRLKIDVGVLRYKY